MKKVLMIAAVAMTTANAAGNFSGVNAGVHGGYGFTKISQAKLKGLLGGLHAGYSHDFGKMVAGLEGDYTFSNVKKSLKSDDVKVTVKRNGSYAIAAKAGFKVTDTVLLGAKVGFARTKFKLTASTKDGKGSTGATQNGLVTGVFVDKLINDHVLVGAGYNFTVHKKVEGAKIHSHDMLVRVGYKF